MTFISHMLCARHYTKNFTEINSFNHCCSATKLCPTLCHCMDAAHQASLSFAISWSLLKFMSIESVMPSSHLILCHPLLLLLLIFPSIKVFPNESALHIRWTKYLIIKITKMHNIVILILELRTQRLKEVA